MENYNNRNEDFMRKVEEICRRGAPGRGRLTVRTAVRMAVESEAPSFYLSRDYAWKKLQERQHTLPPREKPHRRAMWDELRGAYTAYLGGHPGCDPWVALDHVLSHHRPSGFFISEEYAWKLVCRLRRRSRKHQTNLIKKLKKRHADRTEY